jgi:uroporphyrinogen decarboxylase
MGLAILNPVQPHARSMDASRLAAEFGGRIVFHGGVDVQHLLPCATPDQIKEHVARLSETLGAQGGYIRAGSHHIQADTPIENVLAMFSV